MKTYQLARQVDSEKDTGKEIALAFDLGSVNSEKHGQAKLKGHFLAMIPWGEFPKIDIENNKKAEKAFKNWLIQAELTDETDLYRQDQIKLNVAKITSFSAPDIDPQALKPYAYLMIFLTTLESIVQHIKHQSEQDRKILAAAINSLIKALRARSILIDPLPAWFLPCQQSFISLQQEVLATEANIACFIKALADYMQANIAEVEHISDSYLYQPDDCLFIRSYAVAIYPVMELIALIKGLQLPEEIRMHLKFREYFELGIRLVALQNDIYSLKKEINEDETDDNMVFVLVNSTGISFQEAIDETLRRLNNWAIRLKMLSENLTCLFPASQDLSAFKQSLHYVIDGGLYWAIDAERYGLNSQFTSHVVEYNYEFPTFAKSLVTDHGIKHLAIIPDGNRRWAEAQGVSLEAGHQAASDHFFKLVNKSWDLEIHTLTFWLLSDDNLQKRSEAECKSMLIVIEKTVLQALELCCKRNAKLCHLGSKNELPPSLVKAITSAEQTTRHHTQRVLNLAINYGGCQEILQAITAIHKETPINEIITEKAFMSHLYTANQPNPKPDMIIRTGCENGDHNEGNMNRLSGFMPWQSTQSELFGSLKCFQNFTEEDLQAAVEETFPSLRRCFGR